MSSNTEFNNDHLKVLVERHPGCLVKLAITVSTDATKASYKKAIKEVNKDITLPGFRKGKAPEALIIQRYSKYIDQQWHDILVKTTFKEVLNLIDEYPLNENSVKQPKLTKVSKEEGSEIHFEMEIMPKVPQIDLKSVHLQAPLEKEISQEQIDQAIMDLRLHHANWTEITDSPVTEGHFVELDIDNCNDPENPICKNTQLEVSDEKIGNWLKKLIIEKNVGDIVEGESEQESETIEDFVPTKCRITIKKIKTPDLPELDDAFSKKFGLNTIDELYQRVEEDLKKQVKETVRNQLRENAENILTEMYQFDVPSSVFESEKKSRLENLSTIKEKVSDKEFEKISKRYNEENLNQEVLKSIRSYFIMRELAYRNRIEVTQDEILQEMMQYAYNLNSNFITPSMDTNEIRSKLYLTVLNRKTKDFIVDHAIVNQVETSES